MDALKFLSKYSLLEILNKEKCLCGYLGIAILSSDEISATQHEPLQKVPKALACMIANARQDRSEKGRTTS